MDDARSQERNLIQRAPSGYLWNQVFSFWLFFSLFLYQLIITRLMPPSEKGVYELVLTPANFAVYLAALGLESAGSVYLPRALAEGGRREALAVTLQLVALRLGAVLLVAAGLLWGLPSLAGLVASSGLSWTTDFANSMRSPILLDHRFALAAYLVGIGISNLLAALLTALLRTGIVFWVGGAAQAVSIVLAYVFVGPLHGGANGALIALALPGVLMVLAYAIALYRVLPGRPSALSLLTGVRMVQLGIAAWLADLANGSLIKLIAVTQLAVAVSTAHIAFFGVAFEMGHAAALLFVAGLGGVGLAAMSAAYAHQQRAHLAIAWRTISKLQVLLAVPLVAFCVPHADAIILVLYGQPYASVGGLLALFLALNAIVRLAGGGAHEAALYVLGRQRWVVIARWGSLAVLTIGDILLIPRMGAAGALLAVGIAQVGAELFMLVFARLALARPFPVPFILRVLLALAPALAVTTVWRPGSLAGLIVAGLVYAVMFVAALRLVRPLDQEDAALLAQVRPALRAVLMPFAATPLSSPVVPAPAGAPAAWDPSLLGSASLPLPPTAGSEAPRHD
jgi:O-antigen/teichoic acid export membrane protein